MSCLYKTNSFHMKNKTIYQQFLILKNQNAFTTINDEIAFITEKLLYSGLDDVVSIDKKWKEYTDTFETIDKQKYLNFITSLIKSHHINNDSFDTTINIDDI